MGAACSTEDAPASSPPAPSEAFLHEALDLYRSYMRVSPFEEHCSSFYGWLHHRHGEAHTRALDYVAAMSSLDDPVMREAIHREHTLTVELRRAAKQARVDADLGRDEDTVMRGRNAVCTVAARLGEVHGILWRKGVVLHEERLVLPHAYMRFARCDGAISYSRLPKRVRHQLRRE